MGGPPKFTKFRHLSLTIFIQDIHKGFLIVPKYDQPYAGLLHVEVAVAMHTDDPNVHSHFVK